MTHDPRSAAAFENRYRQSGDPWQFAESPYEQGRYRVTLESLSRPCYETAFEPGCSIGELTHGLARRCARLLASDFSASAVAKAQSRCRGLHHVTIRCEDLRTASLNEPLDLVVFSEIGYYWTANELSRIARGIADHLQPGGEWLAVHWLGHSADHVLTGDEVHGVLQECLDLTWIKGDRHPGFRIDSWTR